MKARQPFQFSLRDVLLLTVFAAFSAWTVRNTQDAEMLAGLLFLHATMLLQGVLLLSVVRDVRSSRRGEKHDLAKATMAVGGMVPWFAWLFVGVALAIQNHSLAARQNLAGVQEALSVLLILMLAATLAWNLGSLGYCLGADLPLRYLWLAGLNVALVMAVVGALLSPLGEVARE